MHSIFQHYSSPSHCKAAAAAEAAPVSAHVHKEPKITTHIHSQNPNSFTNSAFSQHKRATQHQKLNQSWNLSCMRSKFQLLYRSNILSASKQPINKKLKTQESNNFYLHFEQSFHVFNLLQKSQKPLKKK